jgi:tetratricopeptide (TPR) repeat protein
MDWLTAGGVPAFLLYLSLFGSAIFLLWRSSELSRSERTLLTAALVGYAVHNLFVFDNLYSYIYFFAILALIDSQVGRPIPSFEKAPVMTATDGITYALPIAAVVCFGLIWFVNITGMQTSSGLIAVLSSSGDPLVSLSQFKDLIARDSFAMQEIREQLVSYAAAVANSQATTNEQKQQALSLAISEMKKQVATYPLDARGYLQLAYAERIAGTFDEAIQALKTAIELSPKKEAFYVEKGSIEWNTGDIKAANEDFATAYALGPSFPELAAYAAAGDIVNGDQKSADKILLTAFGTTTVDSNPLIIAYYRVKNWPKLIRTLRLRTESSTAGPNEWFSLAAAYFESGDRASAVSTINAAVAKFPEAATSGAAAIKQISGQ